jgi:ribonuclease R
MTKAFQRTRKEAPKVFHANRKEGSGRRSSENSSNRKEGSGRRSTESPSKPGQKKEVKQKQKYYEGIAKKQQGQGRKRKKK